MEVCRSCASLCANAVGAIIVDIASATYTNTSDSDALSVQDVTAFSRTITPGNTTTINTDYFISSDGPGLLGLLYSPLAQGCNFGPNTTSIGQSTGFNTTLLPAVVDSSLLFVAYIPYTSDAHCLNENLKQAILDGSAAVLLYPYLAPGQAPSADDTIQIPTLSDYSLPAMAIGDTLDGNDILQQLSLYANEPITSSNMSATHVRVTLKGAQGSTSFLAGFSVYLLILGLVFLLVIFAIATLFRLRRIQIARRRRQYLQEQGITDPSLANPTVMEVMNELAFPQQFRPVQYTVKKEWLDQRLGLHIWHESKGESKQETTDQNPPTGEQEKSIFSQHALRHLSAPAPSHSHLILDTSPYLPPDSSLLAPPVSLDFNFNHPRQRSSLSITEVQDTNIPAHLPPILPSLPLTASLPRQYSKRVDSSTLVKIPKRASSVAPRLRRSAPPGVIDARSAAAALGTDENTTLSRTSTETELKAATTISVGDLLDAKKLDSKDYKYNSSCAICLDDFSSGDVLRVLKWGQEKGCGHAFHAECVDQYLVSRRGRCPNCNAIVGNEVSEQELPVTRGRWMSSMPSMSLPALPWRRRN